MFYGRKRRTPAKKGAKRIYKRKRTTKRKSLIQTIKSVISRQAENKLWTDYGTNQNIVQASTTCPVFRNLVPTLSTGSQKSQRIGNEVVVKNGFVRGFVNIVGYNLTTNPLAGPVYVKMWIVSCKTINTNNFASTPFNEFFDIVNSSAAFQASPLDLMWETNKDQYTVHATKLVRIGVGYTINTQPSWYDNSPSSVPFYFNIGKYMKKLKYDDTDTICTNRNLFIVFQSVNSDGTSGASNYHPAEMHYNIKVEYEDM